MKHFRYAIVGGIAAIVVGLCVGFLSFTHAPPVGGPDVGFYVRIVAGIVAGAIAAGVVWFLTVLTIGAKTASDVGDGFDDDPFDDDFFDR